MANEDLIRFFFISNRTQTTLSHIIRETQKSEASIYLTLWRWSKRGLIRIHRRTRGSESNIFRSNKRSDNTRIYELTESGRKYINYKRRNEFRPIGRKTFENQNQKSQKRY